MFISLTRQPEADPWDGLTGRLNEAILKRISPDFQDRVIFSCGPSGFMKKVKEILHESEFDIENNFFEESFGGSPKAKKKTPPLVKEQAEAFVEINATAAPQAQISQPETRSVDFPAIHFSASQFEVFGGEMDLSILDIAEEIGIEIPSSCRSGSCGSCKLKKVEGKTTCDDDTADGLTEAEREEGYILSCITYANGFVEVVC